MRNISFSLTSNQILNQTKTVTRRLRWLALKPGTLLQPVRKGMGLKKGEHPEKLGCPIRVVTVTREPLTDLAWLPNYGRIEAAREGFPGRTGEWFQKHFAKAMKCERWTVVTRIEFEYTEPK